jgi:hypothetical protein
VMLTLRRLHTEDYGQPISFHTLHPSNPAGLVVENRKTLFMSMSKKWACFSDSLSFPSNVLKRKGFQLSVISG